MQPAIHVRLAESPDFQVRAARAWTQTEALTEHSSPFRVTTKSKHLRICVHIDVEIVGNSSKSQMYCSRKSIHCRARCCAPARKHLLEDPMFRTLQATPKHQERTARYQATTARACNPRNSSSLRRLTQDGLTQSCPRSGTCRCKTTGISNLPTNWETSLRDHRDVTAPPRPFPRDVTRRLRGPIRTQCPGTQPPPPQKPPASMSSSAGALSHSNSRRTAHFFFNQGKSAKTPMPSLSTRNCGRA